MATDYERKKLDNAVYVGIVYEKELKAETLWRIYRVQLFELGHSMTEIDSMTLDDVGDVLGYWSEKKRAESKLDKENKDLGG